MTAIRGLSKEHLAAVLVIALLILFAVACTHRKSDVSNASIKGPGPAQPTPPFQITVDPQDRGRFQEIQNAPIDQRAKLMVTYLQQHGHDIAWYPDNDLVQVKAHQTVQVIYFGSQDYVIEWCSGAFVSDHHIATAGHCSHGSLTNDNFDASGQPLDCRGKVLFAYKPTKDAPITYYGCDKLLLQHITRSETDTPRDASNSDLNFKHEFQQDYEVDDYALFSIGEVNSSALKIRPEFSGTDVFVKWTKSDLTDSSLLDQPTLALVVDPPTGSNAYLSQYNVIVGRMVDPYALFDGWITSADTMFVAGLFNFTRPGNSGSPLYAQLNHPVFPFGSVDIGDANWVFLSPLFGWQTAGGSKAMVYTRPEIVAAKMQTIVH